MRRHLAGVVACFNDKIQWSYADGENNSSILVPILIRYHQCSDLNHNLGPTAKKKTTFYSCVGATTIARIAGPADNWLQMHWRTSSNEASCGTMGARHPT